jgi:hypothetical protein
MALKEAVRRRRCRAVSSSRSRTTSDLEILRRRDSASISATKGSGSRTVRLFTREVYYIPAGNARQSYAVMCSGFKTAPCSRSGVKRSCGSLALLLLSERDVEVEAATHSSRAPVLCVVIALFSFERPLSLL